MRLNLYAKSKKNIAYTPDWVKILFKQNNGVELLSLTLDIQGETSYNKGLKCTTKGVLIPWDVSLFGKTIADYSEMDFQDTSKIFSDSKIAELLTRADEIIVGIYPAINENFENAKVDTIGFGRGQFDYSDDGEYRIVDFKFVTNLNL